MGKRILYVHEDAQTGRLIYRRTFPARLQEYLSPPRREHKVPLNAYNVLNAAAMRIWERAQQEFDRYVERARAALKVEQAQNSGLVECLTPELMRFILDDYKTENLTIDDEVRWLDRPIETKIRAQRRKREDIKVDLEEARALKSLGDINGVLELWGEPAYDHAVTLGYHFERGTPEFRDYVKAFHDTQIEIWQLLADRLDGLNIPTPETPKRPATTSSLKSTDDVDASQLSFQAIVEEMVHSSRKPMSASTKQGVQTALRFFREYCGEPTPDQITRSMVADWLDMLAKRPSKVPQKHRSVPLPDLVELYEGQEEVARLSPKTIRQHQTMLAARWPQARRSGRIAQSLLNPFEDHDVERVRPIQRLGFSTEELQAILNLRIWTAGERPGGGRGEACYWLPLMLLYTGARPEEIAQLLVDDVAQDASSPRWVLRITDEGTHPRKGQQSLKTSKMGSGRRTFPLPEQLLRWGLIDYIRWLKSHNETALFPMLRVKGERNLLFSSFGEWWSKYLKENGVVLRGKGRQPTREMRHTWSTAARRSGISREAMAYIQGHSLPDATSGEGYGDLEPLGEEISKLEIGMIDTTRILSWKPVRANT